MFVELPHEVTRLFLSQSQRKKERKQTTQTRDRGEKAMGSRFGALAEEEYDKIAPVIACTLPALTDSMPERERGELAGDVTKE